jgi:hypothetical protein
MVVDLLRILKINSNYAFKFMPDKVKVNNQLSLTAIISSFLLYELVQQFDICLNSFLDLIYINVFISRMTSRRIAGSHF